MEKLNKGLLYVSLHNQLRKRAGADKRIDRKVFFSIMGKHFLVPKNLRFIILKEMEERNLIKKEKNKILILNCDIDIENNVGEIYKLAGLF